MTTSKPQQSALAELGAEACEELYQAAGVSYVVSQPITEQLMNDVVARASTPVPTSTRRGAREVALGVLEKWTEDSATLTDPRFVDECLVDVITAAIAERDREADASLRALREQVSYYKAIAGSKFDAMVTQARDALASRDQAVKLLNRVMVWASGVAFKSLDGEAVIADIDAFLGASLDTRGTPGLASGLLMTGEHPECPRCHSLRLPDGRCVNGSLCLDARVAPEQCPSCRGTGRMCGHKHCSVPIKHACAACGGTGTAHALIAANVGEKSEPRETAPAEEIQNPSPSTTPVEAGRCGTCGGEGWTLPDPAGPRHTCTACGGSGSTTGGAG